MVFVLDGGALWVTTSRGSVKARSWRRDPSVAGLVAVGTQAVIFRGRVRTYDALDPLSWPASVAAGPRIIRAAAAFSLKNARFFAGYAVDATQVPLAWTPPGRVFARIELSAGKVLDRKEVIDDWGDWPEGVAYRSSFAGPSSSRGIDVKAPLAIRRAVGAQGEGAVAVDAGGRITVLPAAWKRVAREGVYDAIVPDALLRLTLASREAPVALTVDRASPWRAADMSGMLLQGPGHLYSPAETSRGRRALAARVGRDREGMSLLRIHPTRVVWWQGWGSGTVVAR